MLGSAEDAERYDWPRLTDRDSRKQIATVNFSSGTTGLPKGVMITHRNLVANVEQCMYLRTVKNKLENTKERWVGFLPLFHAYGQLHAILMAAKFQIPVYIMTTFVYEDLLQTIQTHKITELQVAPPVVVLLTKHPATSKYDVSSITRISSGAAPLSRSLSYECSSSLNTDIRQGWGMTELTCAGTFLPAGFDDDSGSVGILCPNSEAKLVDENGTEVATGERGEILIRGPNVSPGYWKNEKATKETMLEGGWLRTGDIAVSDERGWFWIVDRLKVNHPTQNNHLLCSYDRRNLSKSLVFKLRPPNWKPSSSVTLLSPMPASLALKMLSPRKRNPARTCSSKNKLMVRVQVEKRYKSGSRER